jgi:hypothetical protein
MTTLTLELPTELVAAIKNVADQTGQPLEAVIADVLTARFVPGTVAAHPDTPLAAGRIRLRPVSLANWPADTAFRREEIYGDDAR